VALSDLSAIPSPYLSGYLDVPDDGMLMVEGIALVSLFL